MDDGLIECVDHFSYLRSVIATENNLDAEIDVMIVKPLKLLEHCGTFVLA